MRPGPVARQYRFVFVSSNGTPWGGSEELWAAAAVSVAEAGHRVAVYKANLDQNQPSIRRLHALGAKVRDFSNVPLVPRKLYNLFQAFGYPLAALHRALRLGTALLLSRPDLVVLSQGGNFDGLLLAAVCRRTKTPFVLISQKAADAYWPADVRRDRIRAAYTEAVASYFVSEHNRRLTEEQLGVALPNAKVVRNPFLVPWTRRTDWPAENGGLRLACVGRLYPAEKGQDLLIRVLAREKWRARPLSVSIYGSGLQREGLEAMAAYYGVTSIKFAGFTNDVAAIWNDHHGLILPSRCEGLPLVLVEAMLSGRVSIVTDVAGNREVVDDEKTGFLAAAATEDALDEALERAWQRRNDWPSIGGAAADRIRELVPESPANAFAELLLEALAEREVEEEGAAEADLTDTTARSETAA